MMMLHFGLTIYAYLMFSMVMCGSPNLYFMGFVFRLMQIQQKESLRGFQYTFPGTLPNSTFSLMDFHSEFALFSYPV